MESSASLTLSRIRAGPLRSTREGFWSIKQCHFKAEDVGAGKKMSLPREDFLLPCKRRNRDWPGTVARTCNPSTLGGWGRWISRQADHEVKRSRPAWPTWWNPVSTKNIKKFAAHTYNPSYLGGQGRRIAWTWVVEVAVSRDHTTAPQPGW